MTKATARAALLAELLAGEDSDAPEYPDAVNRLQRLIDDVIAEATGRMFLAEYEGAEPALFSTPDAAREYCDDFARAEADGRCWDWMPEEDGVQQQCWVHEDNDRPTYATGGSVTALQVDAETA